MLWDWVRKRFLGPSERKKEKGKDQNYSETHEQKEMRGYTEDRRLIQ